MTDASAVDDDIIKVAFYAFGPAERTVAPALAPFTGTHQVVVSGEHWVDVMNRTANKGTALRRLQRDLGITPAQTAVFGDYLNDLEMMAEGDWSFAMDNGHGAVQRAAQFIAPRNTDEGVVQVLRRLLGV